MLNLGTEARKKANMRIKIDSLIARDLSAALVEK